MSGILTWQLRDRILDPGDPALVMGIVNVTPDSFSDGGRFRWQRRCHRLRLSDLIEPGGRLLDVGGESSRPVRPPSRSTKNCRRVVPWSEIGRLTRGADPLSVDTTKAAVADAALAGRRPHRQRHHRPCRRPDSGEVVRRTSQDRHLLMHMRGTPATMQVTQLSATWWPNWPLFWRRGCRLPSIWV